MDTPCIWKNQRATAMSGPVTSPNCNFTSPMSPSLAKPSLPMSRVATPEQIMASDEMLRLIASALRDVGSGPREAFILHAIEGFTIDEISGDHQPSGRPRARVSFPPRAITCARRPV